MDVRSSRIAVIGLGYVGLPLAVEFGKQYQVVGFDVNTKRVDELRNGYDTTLEVSAEAIRSAARLSYTADPGEIKNSNVFIVTVPTPIDRYKRPDLTPLIRASETVGRYLKVGDVVIYESTVYPGATGEICVPVLEKESGLIFNKEFFCGYSPERINPGDKEHRVTTIKKITSGSNQATARFVDELYASIITAGTFKASSIQVAEAAKVIENTQRDVNIALVNELSLIFKKLGIRTDEVLEAASTKWNFLPFRPGLVGGHCIGVDPYYLTHKAQEIGFHPEMILAGRRINDMMGTYVAEEVVKLMARKRVPIANSRVLVMGLTFKENCPDLRNTRVTDIIRELQTYEAIVDVYDPWIAAQDAKIEYGLNISTELERNTYDAIVIAVAHAQFKKMGIETIRALGKRDVVIFDVKSVFPSDEVDGQL